jgi:hypothetical protein
MIAMKESYLVNEQGVRIGVLLDIEAYQKMLDALEELECIRAYDEAKASGDRVIPIEEAIKQIEDSRE